MSPCNGFHRTRRVRIIWDKFPATSDLSKQHPLSNTVPRFQAYTSLQHGTWKSNVSWLEVLDCMESREEDGFQSRQHCKRQLRVQTNITWNCRASDGKVHTASNVRKCASNCRSTGLIRNALLQNRFNKPWVRPCNGFKKEMACQENSKSNSCNIQSLITAPTL